MKLAYRFDATQSAGKDNQTKMWGRKDRPESVPTPTTPEVEPQRPQRQARPPSAASSVARLGKSLKLKGNLSGKEDLYIDGEVEGNVQFENCCLTIGPSGTVKADIQARSVVILGRVKGNVQATDRTEIRNSGNLEGDLITARVIVEEEAIFRGSIDIVKPKDERASSEVAKRDVRSSGISEQKSTPETATARAAKTS